MNIPEEFAHEHCEHDEDGIPRFQMYRNSDGKLLRKRIPEEARTKLRVALFMDQLHAALQHAHKALAEEGLILFRHGGDTNPDALRRHWTNTAKTLSDELNCVQQPATKLKAAIKQLFDV